MKQYRKETVKSNTAIDTVETTNDVLTSRGGLILFVRYLNAIGILERISKCFGHFRKSRKGRPVEEIFKQLWCFFLDGTSRHLSYFDKLAKDQGYARGIETDPEKMLSSHAVKRFFMVLLIPTGWIFRRILLDLFIWRLKIESPNAVLLGLDSMVMDNDEAKKRHGVKHTYKNVNGFHPIQMTWNRFVIDAIFRSGNWHSNHGNDTLRMMRRVVKAIRNRYRSDVAIVFRMDSGFFDQKIFEFCEKEHIGYICGGKLYEDIKTYTSQCDESFKGQLKKVKQVWQYLEFGDKRDTWKIFRRAIFCRPIFKDQQMLLEFDRPCTIIYTNIGTDAILERQLRKSDASNLLSTGGIIDSYHARGADELVHRAFKDFGFQQLPFLRFHQNAAFYYTMIIGFVLFECFKADVCSPVIDVTAYAATLRRQLIDIAAKIVRHAGKTILKISRAVFECLQFDLLWEKSSLQSIIY